MATDSVMGLFADPQQIQQAQRQQFTQTAADLSQMDPSRLATFYAMQGGYGLGNAIGSALGAEDPQLKMASLRRQVLQGVNQADAKSLAQAAQKLSEAGDIQGANALAQQSVAIQAKIDERQAQRASMEAIAAGRNETALQIADLRAQMAQATSGLQAQLIQAKIDALNSKQNQARTLPASLQKEEGKDLEVIDTYTGQAQALKPALDALTPDEKGVRKLELGPLKNAKYEAQLLAGNSTPEARAYEGLKSAVDTAVNLQVSAEKGVQTDKDVLRFAKALIASYGRNDTEASYQALKRYQKALVSAQERTKGRLESRRKSQGVDPYYVGETAQQPKRIKLD